MTQLIDCRQAVDKEIEPGLSVRLYWALEGDHYCIQQQWLPERPDMLPGDGRGEAVLASGIEELKALSTLCSPTGDRSVHPLDVVGVGARQKGVCLERVTAHPLHKTKHGEFSNPRGAKI